MSIAMSPQPCRVGARMGCEEAAYAFRMCGEFLAVDRMAAAIVALCLRNAHSEPVADVGSSCESAGVGISALRKRGSVTLPAGAVLVSDVDAAMAGLLDAGKGSRTEQLVVAWIAATQRSLAKAALGGGGDCFFDCLLRACMNALARTCETPEQAAWACFHCLDSGYTAVRAWLAAGVERVKRAVREARAVTLMCGV